MQASHTLDTPPSLDIARHARPHIGLHGHPLHGNTLRAATAELVGTFILVLAITGTAVAAALNTPVAGVAYGSQAVPLAAGFALLIAVAAVGQVSGAHLNPAVTVALALTRRLPWRHVPAYLIAQLAGSVLAALAVWAIDGPKARSVADLGATLPAHGVSGGRTLLVEAVATFILMLVVISVATDSRIPRVAAALAIGLALGVAVFISGPITGAGVNPARALGPMLVSGHLTAWWAYLAGPVIGASVAAALYEYVFKPVPMMAP